MEIKKPEIVVLPKTVYWVQMPPSIEENDRIDLLKNDILLVGCENFTKNLVNIHNKNEKFSAFFYNLDGIIKKYHIEEDKINIFLQKVAKLVKNISLEKSLVHTTIIDKNISKLFKDQRIMYLEKNLNNRKIAIASILTLIYPFFSYDNILQRSLLRLNLFPMKYKVAISSVDTHNLIADGYLKDLSLNGMGIILGNRKNFKIFKLKKLIEVNILMHNSKIIISNAIITRVDEDKLEIGVTYNINDNKMVRSDYASYLTRLMYSLVKEIIEEKGYIQNNSNALIKLNND